VSEQRTIDTRTIGDTGRYIIQAGTNVFISDSAAARENPVAPEPTHLLLSALGVCAIGSVEKEAQTLGVKIGGATANATSIKDPNDPTRFEKLHIDVVVRGVTQPVAEKLVDHFTSHCPIYNTFRRGGPITVAVSVAN
jgi:uncharacterized OsmC-like protein